MRWILKFLNNLFNAKVVLKEDYLEDDTLYPAQCGHETKLVEAFEINGEPHRIKLELKEGKASYCFECFKKMIIRCAWCGGSIFPDEPITLYSPKDKSWESPEYAVAYQDGPNQCLVGCLRWNCAETGGDRAGFWVSPGVVKRVVSPLELSMGLTAVVGVSDLSDQNEEPFITPMPKLKN